MACRHRIWLSLDTNGCRYASKPGRGLRIRASLGVPASLRPWQGTRPSLWYWSKPCLSTDDYKARELARLSPPGPAQLWPDSSDAWLSEGSLPSPHADTPRLTSGCTGRAARSPAFLVSPALRPGPRKRGHSQPSQHARGLKAEMHRLPTHASPTLWRRPESLVCALAGRASLAARAPASARCPRPPPDKILRECPAVPARTRARRSDAGAATRDSATRLNPRRIDCRRTLALLSGLRPRKRPQSAARLAPPAVPAVRARLSPLARPVRHHRPPPAVRGLLGWRRPSPREAPVRGAARRPRRQPRRRGCDVLEGGVKDAASCA